MGKGDCHNCGWPAVQLWEFCPDCGERPRRDPADFPGIPEYLGEKTRAEWVATFERFKREVDHAIARARRDSEAARKSQEKAARRQLKADEEVEEARRAFLQRAAEARDEARGQVAAVTEQLTSQVDEERASAKHQIRLIEALLERQHQQSQLKTDAMEGESARLQREIARLRTHRLLWQLAFAVTVPALSAIIIYLIQ